MNRSLFQPVALIGISFALIVAGLVLSAGMGGEMFMPHSHCYLFNRSLMILHGGSDFLIGTAYVAISGALLWHVLRARRELPFHWMMVAFAIFIVACGAMHFMELWTLNAAQPRYWMSGWVKLVTAIASVTTAIALPALVPRVIALIRSARLSTERGGKLERAYGEIDGGQAAPAARSQDLAALVRELAETKAAAEKANTTKDDFLAVLSHELRTPLTPALALASDLETNPPSDPAAWREALGVIRRNIELEARLVDDLLDLTRISRGKLRIASVPVDLHRTLRDALTIAEPMLREKNIAVTADLTAADHLVRGDAARLAQVFANLLTNAAKFTPEAGRVTVRTANAEGELRVAVVDTGIGIAPEVLPKIFDAFRQGGDGTTRRFGGLGLGLAVARNLVEAHGGRISATSPGRDRGATFNVALPVFSGAIPDPLPHTTPAASTRRALRVLLVEDHADTRDVLRRLLERWGHTVTLAGSVAEARTNLAAEEFDLLLSDIGLPDGSGLEVVTILRARSGIPAVAMSGYGMEADLARAEAAGFTGHIVKPVAAERLREIVERVMQGWHGAAG
jgi:signal transduction histidine kinase